MPTPIPQRTSPAPARQSMHKRQGRRSSRRRLLKERTHSSGITSKKLICFCGVLVSLQSPCFSRFQRSVALLQLSVALTYRDAEASAEVIFIGHFVAHRRQFRVIFQPLSDHCGVTEDAVDTPVLQIQFCVLVAVIRNGSDFPGCLSIMNFWCVVRSVRRLFCLSADQHWCICLADPQTGLSCHSTQVVDQPASFWGDIHPGHHRFHATEFQAWDQAVDPRLEKVQVASISLHSACARSTSKPTIWLFASIDSNGGYARLR